MPYYLCGYGENHLEGIVLNENEGSSLIALKKFIDNYSSIEQKYDIAIENFMNFELKLIQFTFVHHLRSDLSNFPNEIKTSGIHTSLVNLILSLGVFIEQFSNRYLNKIANDSVKLRDIAERFSALRKDIPEINFLTSLRDYTAHRDIPLNLLTINSKWDRSDEKENNRLGHVPYHKFQLVN